MPSNRRSSRRRTSSKRRSSARRRSSSRPVTRSISSRRRPSYKRLRKTAPRNLNQLKRSLKNKPVYWTRSGKRPSFRTRRSYVADLARKSRRSKKTTRGPNKGKYRIDRGQDLYIVPWKGSPRSKIGRRGYGWM